MSHLSSLYASYFLLAVFSYSPAFASPEETQLLAQRGNGVVSQTIFSARINKIPLESRFSVLRDRARLRDILNALLLHAQLAADARDAEFDKEDIVIKRMQLAADTELAVAWLQRYIEIQPEGDYEQLAFEYYQLHHKSMLTSPKIDVSHILISTRERSGEDAKELADSISQQLVGDSAKFDQLITEYSEDPSASANQGRFSSVKKGDMVYPFEKAAFALEAGEISAPVETEYGFHIIRLDAHIAPEKVDFDDVKQQLEERERKKHQDRIKRDYLESLTSIDVKMTEEALLEMVRSQFGVVYTDSPEGGQE